MIRTIEVDGVTRVSPIPRYLYPTADLLRSRTEGCKGELGACKYCHVQWYREISEGKIQCICWLMEKEKRLQQRQQHASTSQGKSWESFEIWGDSASKSALMNAIEVVDEWSKNMDRWLGMV